MTARCENCGQICLADDAWSVRGFCALCQTVAYGAGESHEASRLFDAPAPMAGQSELFNPDERN